MVRGKAEYLFKDNSFTATPENFFYPAKESFYAIKVREKSHFICIDFDFEEIEVERKSELYSIGSVTLKNDFERIFRIWTQKDPWYLSDTMSTIYGLQSLSLRSKTKIYSQKSEKFGQILDCLIKNYSDSDFTVEELAKQSGMSTVHLRRLFASSVGASPVKYLNNLRLNKAKSMLATTDYSIEQIALSIGMKDRYYFSRLFKKETGITPTAYRNIKQ